MAWVKSDDPGLLQRRRDLRGRAEAHGAVHGHEAILSHPQVSLPPEAGDLLENGKEEPGLPVRRQGNEDEFPRTGIHLQKRRPDVVEGV